MAGNGRPDLKTMQTLNPETLRTLLQDDATIALKLILDLMEQQMPAGVIQYTALTATTEADSIPFDPPWHSLQVINDGLIPLLFTINNPIERPVEIQPGEDIRFDFQRAVIKDAFFSTPSGSVPFRLIGTR